MNARFAYIIFHMEFLIVGFRSRNQLIICSCCFFFSFILSLHHITNYNPELNVYNFYFICHVPIRTQSHMIAFGYYLCGLWLLIVLMFHFLVPEIAKCENCRFSTNEIGIDREFCARHDLFNKIE